MIATRIRAALTLALPVVEVVALRRLDKNHLPGGESFEGQCVSSSMPAIAHNPFRGSPVANTHNV